MPERGAFDVNTASAAATALAVRDGTISAREACDAAIARIERLDGPINAVVVRDFDRARAAARRIDATRAKDDRRPLLGVPMTVKESNDVAGLPSTWGMPVFKDLPVHEDGIAVARLKSAGAVILGKTNAPVALADWQAVNPIYGRTVNPYDHTRSPGGSSGGAAAALAAGMVPLELGSDIGGSIRVPAHMCGVFGHKPTYGLIPLKGHGFPGTDTVDVPLAVLGPMARSVEDLNLSFDVLAGPVAGVAYKLDLPPPRHATLSGYRILVLDTHPSATTATTVHNALHTLAAKLDRAGARVDYEASGLPDLTAAHRAYTKMLAAITTRGTPGVTPIDAHAWMELEDEQMRLARHWQTVFTDFDVVLTPPFGTPAFPHEDNPNWGARTLKIDGKDTPYGAQVAWPGVATFPGLPATAAPIGKTAEGLPIGVQIMGAKFDDRTTLAFANLLEQDGLTA
jgi:amidase